MSVLLLYVGSKGGFAEAAEQLSLDNFQYGIGGAEACAGGTGVDASDGAVDGIFSVVVAHVGMTVEKDTGFFPCGRCGGHEDIVFDVQGMAVGQEESEAVGDDDPAGRQFAGISPFIAVASDGMGGDIRVFCLQIGEVPPSVSQMDHHIHAAVGQMVGDRFLHEGRTAVCIGKNKNFHGRILLVEKVLSAAGVCTYTGKDTTFLREDGVYETGEKDDRSASGTAG